MHEITVRTQSHTEFVVLDHEIQTIIDKTGVDQGVVYISVPHTTAGVTINENADPDVVRDMTMILDRIVPWEGGYAHAEGNSAAHVKASMMGNCTHVPIENGRLQFGTWQSVYFCEFDGPRQRKVWIQVISS